MRLRMAVQSSVPAILTHFGELLEKSVDLVGAMQMALNKCSWNFLVPGGFIFSMRVYFLLCSLFSRGDRGELAPWRAGSAALPTA